MSNSLQPHGHQAPPSVGFSRQEYWSGLPFPSPGDLPDPWIEPRLPALHGDALPSEPPGKPQVFTQNTFLYSLFLRFFLLSSGREEPFPFYLLKCSKWCSLICIFVCVNLPLFLIPLHLSFLPNNPISS